MALDRNSAGTPEWQGEAAPRLILGTAQLGMDYGIANTAGRPDPQRARAVVEAAWQAGIRHFDTAQAYGDSEAVLGEAIRTLGIGEECRVGTKLSAELDVEDPAGVERALEASLERLGIHRLWYVLLHNPDWLEAWDRGIGAVLQRYRRGGHIAHLGASLRTIRDAPLCLNHHDMEIIQAPCNAWDRRADEWGVLRSARERGQLPCVRSVYLQGLLVLPLEEVARRLPAAKDAAQAWHELADRFGMSPPELALRYALTLHAPLVVGAESPEQVTRTAAWVKGEPLSAQAVETIAQAMDPLLTEHILEPVRWNPAWRAPE